MSVQRLVLFCSTTSKACSPCIGFSYQHKLPVEIVRLDTKESRTRARHGKYFQVSVVPTLVVIRTGGDVQLFSGQEKIMAWFHSVFLPKKESPPSSPQIREVDSDEDMEVVESKPRKHRRRRTKKKKSKKKTEPVISEDEDEEIEIDFIDTNSAPSTNGLLVGAQAPRTKSKGESLQALAKKMEQERKNSTWYSKDDSKQ